MTLNLLLIYYEPQPSGQTAHVLSLARGLDRSRFRIQVVLPDHLEDAAEAFRQTGAAVVPLSLRKAVWSPVTISSLLRLIRDTGVDIVHVHSQEAGLLARLVARLAGVRGRAARSGAPAPSGSTGTKAVFYTPQTIDIRRARWHRVYTWVERALSIFTDRIISVADSDRHRLISWGIPAHKVVTVPNGIDLAPFALPVDREALRRELGLLGPLARDDRGIPPLVLQVGRLTAQKDPLAFVEGAARVLRDCPEAHFALVGEGPLREGVSARVRELGLGDHVHLPGWRDRAYRLGAAADAVTLTSRWEGTPYALLEAMAWSRPVVANAVNGCPEIVVDGVTGFLVPPGDTAAWAARVVELLQDPDRARILGRQGRQRIEERFTLPQMVARIEQLYLQAVGPG